MVQSVHEDDALVRGAPSLVYWPALMENVFGEPKFGRPTVAFVVRSERTGTASFIDEISQAVWSVNADLPDRARAYDAGSLRRLARADVVRARDARDRRLDGARARHRRHLRRDRVRRFAADARDRHPARARRRAPRRETMFLLHGLALSGVGVVVGLVAALALTRLMSSLLFGIEPPDVATYLAAIGVILAAAAFASYLPARRAAAIDPVETLKAE